MGPLAFAVFLPLPRPHMRHAASTQQRFFRDKLIALKSLIIIVAARCGRLDI